MKKIFTLLTLLVCVCTGAWASTVSDLKTIATDYVFIADNFTNVGTTQLTNNTLYDGGLVLACGSGGTKTVSTGKGTSTIEGTVYKNSLRVKTTQDNYAFKVSGPCTLTIYKQAWNDRYFYVGTSNSDKSYYEETVGSATTLECNITAAGVVYIWSSTDVYFAGFKVTFPKTGQPTIGTNPVSAEYSQGDVATALSVSATAANSGALSYQWYKNETNQSVLAGEGATAIDGANSATYAPSTTTAGTTYYFCKVTEEGNANVATSRMAKVLVNPSGFDVTYSLGSVTGTMGTLPSNVSFVNNVTIPVNKTLYKDGYTLTAWNDGSADHAIGDVVALTADVTLTPVFTANGASTYLGRNASTATWGFKTSNGDPTWNLEGFGVETKGYYVVQTSVGGNNMDLLMTMDATNGKINNSTNDTWAQMNANTVLTIPVIVGAEVAVKVYNEGSTPLSFGGNAGTYDSGIYSYTATADGTLDITIADQGYVQYVTVTYPSESAVLTVSANNTEIALTKSSIDGVDYLTAVTDSWQTGKTYGDYTGDFVNMSKAERYITVDVTGAKYFEVFVQNGTAGRTYTVKVGDAAAQEVIHAGGNIKSSGVFAIADPTATTTIKIAGGGSNASSVYPVAIKFNPAASGTISASGWNTFSSSYKLDLSTISGGTAYVAESTAGNNVTLTSTTARSRRLQRLFLSKKTVTIKSKKSVGH